MGLYVGISGRSGDLVIGDMLIELTVTRGHSSETIAILDYEDNKIHPVPACINILPNFPN